MNIGKCLCTWSKSVFFEKGVIYNLDNHNAVDTVFMECKNGTVEYIPVNLNEVYATFEVVMDE